MVDHGGRRGMRAETEGLADDCRTAFKGKAFDRDAVSPAQAAIGMRSQYSLVGFLYSLFKSFEAKTE